MSQVIVTFMCLIVALVYAYLISLVCSKAYFKAKLAYQNSFLVNFNKKPTDVRQNVGESQNGAKVQ